MAQLRRAGPSNCIGNLYHHTRHPPKHRILQTRANEASARRNLVGGREFTADGQVRPPLTNDDFRWQRVIFEYPNYMEIQSMDGKVHGYRLQLDLPNKKATLKKRGDPNWIANLEVVQSSPEILELKGQFDSHLIDAKSTRFDEQKFLLHSRGFHWITEQCIQQIVEENHGSPVRYSNRTFRSRELMTPPVWSLPKRIGFRFIFIYFGLFVLPFPIYFLPFFFS